MKTLKLLAILTITLVSAPSSATVMYAVSSAVTNCPGAPHGLWTSTDQGSPSCAENNYFDIQDGSTFTIFNNSANTSDWYAELAATAINEEGLEANIFIRFTDFAETTSASVVYKKEGGLAFNPANDGPALAAPENFDIDFFTGIDFRDSLIDIDGDIFTFNSANEFVGNHAFQFGVGANAKSKTDFGGSAWIQPLGRTSHHWDLNLTFTRVPEPASVLLMGIGFLALGFRRTR